MIIEAQSGTLQIIIYKFLGEVDVPGPVDFSRHCSAVYTQFLGNPVLAVVFTEHEGDKDTVVTSSAINSIMSIMI